MIDLHTHILPGIDDGAKNFEESKELIKQASRQGIKEIVLTPHIYFPALSDTFFQTLETQTALLRDFVEKNDLGIKLHNGTEIFYQPNLVEFLEKYPVTINGGRYFLIEFGLSMLPEKKERILENFFQVQTRNYMPILAHPERNHQVIRNPNLLYEFVQHGILVQINAGSLLGLFGRHVRQIAVNALKHDLVHAIASDVHNLSSRPYLLVEAVEHYSKYDSVERIINLVEVYPRHIVRNETFEPPDCSMFKNRRFEFLHRLLGR